jgi:hypothetical protein
MTLTEIPGLFTLMIAFVGIVLIAVIEQRGDNLMELQPKKQSEEHAA